MWIAAKLNEDVSEPVSLLNTVTLNEELAKAEIDNMDIKTLGKILSFNINDVDTNDMQMPNALISPTLGELCHTKQRLTLNLSKSTSLPSTSSNCHEKLDI